MIENDFNNLDRCQNCNRLSKGCLAYLMTLPSEVLLEWCRKKKKEIKMSNQTLATLTEIPKGTIDRLFSGEYIDFRHSIILRVVCALAGCSPQDIICIQTFEKSESVEVLKQEIERKENTIIELVHEQNKMLDNLQKLREDAEAEIKYLEADHKRKNRIIAILAVLLAIAIGFIILQ